MKNLLFLLILAAPISAQTWVTIGTETDVVTFNQATTYSFGALAGTTVSTKMLCSAVTRNCFKSFSAVSGATVVFNSNFTDPAPGVTKIVQVLQTASAQTGTTTHNGVKAPWTVPAAAVALPPTSLPSGTITPITQTVSCASGAVAGTLQCNIAVTYKVAP